jgi:magnesium transporter
VVSSGIPEDGANWEELILADPEVLQQEKNLLAVLHPADLVKILCDSSAAKCGLYLKILGAAQIAGALERIKSRTQKDLFIEIPEEKRLQVLEHMAPEKAFGLINRLSAETRDDLLLSLDARAAREIQKIASYPKNTAGCMMNREFTALQQELNVETAIRTLRQTGKNHPIPPFLYLTDPQNQLVGVVSLTDLLSANSEKPLSELSQKPLIYVKITDSVSTVTQCMAHYGLSIVPVVDDHHHIIGVVHSDNDARQVFSPSWRGHLYLPNK